MAEPMKSMEHLAPFAGMKYTRPPYLEILRDRLFRALKPEDEGPPEDHVFDFHDYIRLVISVEGGGLFQVLGFTVDGAPPLTAHDQSRVQWLWHQISTYRAPLIHTRTVDGVVELRYKAPENLAEIAAEPPPPDQYPAVSTLSHVERVRERLAKKKNQNSSPIPKGGEPLFPLSAGRSGSSGPNPPDSGGGDLDIQENREGETRAADDGGAGGIADSGPAEGAGPPSDQSI